MDENEKNLPVNNVEDADEKFNEIKRQIALKETGKQEKALSEVTMDDIKFTLDANKSFDEQAEDVAGALATARALAKEEIAGELTHNKAEELVGKAKAKASKAKQQAIEAETEVQKAERDLYEAVLNTFGIYKHLPRWLMKILVMVLSPLYTVLTFLIGLPCGIVKIVIDNLDGIVCRYEQTEKGLKAKIKTVLWILLIISVTIALCVTLLKCFKVI